VGVGLCCRIRRQTSPCMIAAARTVPSPVEERADRPDPRPLPDCGRHRLGGMGEVYLATDTKLGREVALKVLPAEVARDPDRLARFQREAKALAALDHPNIVTVFSVEEANGIHFLTMQLVDGQPLDRLIPEHGLPSSGSYGIATAAGRRARHGARERHRAPRSQTRQRHGRARRPRDGARLRPRERAARRRSGRGHVHLRGADPGGRRDGNARVHVARAGRGAPGGSPHRPLLARGAALRDGERRAPVPRRLVGRAGLGDPARHAPALERDQDGPDPGTGAHHPALP